MIFPITELLNDQASMAWIEKHFHPKGLRCPSCTAKKIQAREFRWTKRGLVDYRCRACEAVYNLYSGTLFSGSNLHPRQTVLLLRGVCKGESSQTLAAELGLSRQSVHLWRQRLQANGYRTVEETPVPDRRTETDEMFQNAGEKRGKAQKHGGPAPSPREQEARPWDLRQ
jgi:transposase-like protein